MERPGESLPAAPRIELWPISAKRCPNYQFRPPRFTPDQDPSMGASDTSFARAKEVLVDHGQSAQRGTALRLDRTHRGNR